MHIRPQASHWTLDLCGCVQCGQSPGRPLLCVIWLPKSQSSPPCPEGTFLVFGPSVNHRAWLSCLKSVGADALVGVPKGRSRGRAVRAQEPEQ